MERCVSIVIASLCVALVGRPVSAQDIALNVGDEAPEIEATTADGEVWTRDQVRDKYLVLYFYPAAMTGGCTKQACAFRDDRTKLLKMGAEVVGVSGDRVEGLRIFKQAHNLNFPLLSDEQGAIARSFGVPVGDGGTVTREVGGEEVQLTRDISTARWTFIIAPDGKIVYRDTEVDAAGDSQNVIDALQRLTGESG